MSQSIENYYLTTKARTTESFRVHDGQSQESILLQNLKPRFDSFADTFPLILPRYAMSFEGSFMTASPEDQRIFTGAIFAGLIVEELYKDTLVDRAPNREGPRTSAENQWLNKSITATTKKILDGIGIETVATTAYMGSSIYDRRIAQRSFLTADNDRVLLDPTLMLTEPCDISPAGLMSNKDGRTYQDNVPEVGAVYVGLDMRAKYYSAVKPYPEAWYRR